MLKREHPHAKRIAAARAAAFNRALARVPTSVRKSIVTLKVKNLWTPPMIWKGQDAFLIGGGSSLLGYDFTKLQGLNVIGCNDACFLGFPPLSYCVFGDAGWWHRNRHAIEKMPGTFVSNAPSILHYQLNNVFRMRRVRDGIQTGDCLGWNYSTGALAINLAVSLGASRIFLLGYDLSNQNNKSHWHDRNLKIIRDSSLDRFGRGFAVVAQSLRENFPGVSVFNVTDGSSRLKSFSAISFAEFQAVLDSRSKAEGCAI